MKTIFPFLFLLTLTACTKEHTATIGEIGVSVTAFLQGSYNSNTGLMNKTLNRNGLLPYYSPYGGGEHLTSNLDSNVVDWVSLEAWHNGEVRGKTAAVILSNGVIVDVNNRAIVGIQLYQPSQDSMYDIVLRHRNHLAVRTRYPVNATHNAIVNFSFAPDVCYQNMAYTSTAWSGGAAGRWLIRGGDANGNGFANNNGPNSDWTYLKYLPPYLLPQYSNADINMDSYVNGADIDFLNNVVLEGHLGGVFHEQL